MKIIINPERKDWERLLKRPQHDTSSLNEIVSGVLNEIKNEGDDAVRRYELKFDKADLKELAVGEEEMTEAECLVPEELKSALKTAASNIKKFHEAQSHNLPKIETTPGVVCYQKAVAIEKVGLYVPGGTAPLFSTVLMLAIPADIAGCKEIVLCTPPNAEGKVNPTILYAAKISGVKKIFKIGGIQAIGAMAYGTESVPKVYKIFGPGNQFVMAAKQLVSIKDVAIDMPAGPSEVAVIADNSASADAVAADMLSQAEHDRMATAVLVTNSDEFAQKVSESLEKIIPTLPRKEIARASIDNNGKIIVTSSIEKAIEASNEIAPEHLELCIDNPFDYLSMVRNAGSVFMGRNCPEALGDYFAGPNHTLPTSGTARFSSPLSVEDFVKKSAYTYYTAEALDRACKSVVTIAEEEGLYAHGRSVSYRCELRKKG